MKKLRTQKKFFNEKYEFGDVYSDHGTRYPPYTKKQLNKLFKRYNYKINETRIKIIKNF